MVVTNRCKHLSDGYMAHVGTVYANGHDITNKLELCLLCAKEARTSLNGAIEAAEAQYPSSKLSSNPRAG